VWAVDVTARRHGQHQSRTTRVWNVLDGMVQGRFWVLDCVAQGVGFGFFGFDCAARGGLGFWVPRKGSSCMARKGSGFWLYGVKKDLDMEDCTHCI